MNIKKLLLQGVSFAMVASFGVLLTAAHADSAVLGQIQPQASITINPGAASEYTVDAPTPYISGDMLSTMGGKHARVVGNNGNVVTLSEDTMASVDSIEPLSVTLIDGAFKFAAAAGTPAKIATPNGVFTVSSDEAFEGLAVYQNGEFAVKSEQGLLTIESDSSITKIDRQTAFVYADGNAKTVDVLEGENGILIALLAAAAVIAGIIIIADDDTPTSP